MSTIVSYYQARLGAEFSVAGKALTLVLSGVDASASPQVFSLTFQGPAAPVLEQQTLVLERAGEAALAIFVVPAMRNGVGMQYHAVFNN